MATRSSSYPMGHHWPFSSSVKSEHSPVYSDGDYAPWQQQSYGHQQTYISTRLTSWPQIATGLPGEELTTGYASYSDPPCNAGYGYPGPCGSDEYWTKPRYQCHERHDSPYSGPEDSLSPRSQDEYNPYARPAVTSHANTIAMMDVQPDSGHNYEAVPYGTSGLQVHEGHTYPGDLVESPLPSEWSHGARCGSQPSAPKPSIPPPVIRHRKTSRPSLSTVQGASRISKRVSLKRAAATATRTEQTYNSDSETDHERPFHCPLAPYGCVSTFSSKNEWKRHFSTQHMRLGFWRCDQCPSAERKPNDFNRKDLFVQHFRRMHGYKDKSPPSRKKKSAKHNDEERAVSAAAQRCYMQMRSPPLRSICVVCEHPFSGHGSWDERMEHIGKHFESAKKDGVNSSGSIAPKDWALDTEVEDWMIDEKILIQDRDAIVIAGDYSG